MTRNKENHNSNQPYLYNENYNTNISNTNSQLLILEKILPLDNMLLLIIIKIQMF